MLINQDITSDDEAKELICELGRRFYQLGWVSGTGGGISIRHQERVFMAPSGVQKEALSADMIYTLDRTGRVIEGPASDAGLKVSECCPLFMHAFNKRDAGAVIHSHSLSAMLITLVHQECFSMSHVEMLKGLHGVGFNDTHDVPIIQNTPREAQLSDSLAQAMDAYPKSHAVLVQRHGVYVWGRKWIEAKKHAECYDYLFQAGLEMHKLGLSANTN